MGREPWQLNYLTSCPVTEAQNLPKSDKNGLVEKGPPGIGKEVLIFAEPFRLVTLKKHSSHRWLNVTSVSSLQP